MFKKMLGKNGKGKSSTEDMIEEIAVAPETAEETSGIDEAMRRAAASKSKAAAFGEIVALLMRSPRHNRFTLADLTWLAVPAVLSQQYSIAKVKPKDDPSSIGVPAGVAFWARLSDELDRKLSVEMNEPLRLKPADWTSGPHYWLLDIVASPKVASAMLDELKRNAFAGKTFKLRQIKDGKASVVQLEGVAETSA